MAKQFLKRFWPLAAFALLLIAGGLFLLIRSRLPGPRAAVEGYVVASMHYDVDDMLFYASDYQKKALAGNADVPPETLRANLKAFYASGAVSPETRDIVFSKQTVTDIEEGTERYRAYLEEYGYKADAESVDALALVTASCSVGGRHFADYRVVAVRCGLRWYYGFIPSD